MACGGHSCDEAPCSKLYPRISTFTVVLGLAATGCGKKSSSEEKPATTEAAKPATTEAAKPATTEAAKPEAAKPEAAKPTGKISSDDEYIATGKASKAKLAEIFKTNGTDCDKLAKDIDAFAQTMAEMIKESTAYEKAHPEVSQKFEEASKAENEAMQGSVMDAMTACKDSEALRAAMEKLAPG